MKRYFTLLLLCVLTLSWARADSGGFTTPSVKIDAVVHENSVWDITETIVVDFNEPRHGIYRYIPARFFYAFKPDGYDKEFVYKNIIDVHSVDGYKYDVERDDTKACNTIIKIGSANSTVYGQQTYVIRYSIQYLDDRYNGEDFLCHSIWGSGWNTAIDHLEFNIKFDKQLPDGFAQSLNLYSGSRGEVVNADNVVLDVKGNSLVGYVNDLPHNHAITVSAQLPEGYWKPQGKNMAVFYIFVALTLVMAVLYLWNAITTRHSAPVRVVSFYPPKDMSSAQVGKIIDDSTDPEDLASLIPWLAHRGYLTITEVPDSKGRMGKHADLLLEKKLPLLPDAPSYQKHFMKAIFGSKKSVYLSNLGDRHYEMDRATKALDALYKGEHSLTTVGSGALWWFFMLVGFVGIMWTSDITDMFDVDHAMWGGLPGAIAALIVGLMRLIGADKRWFKKASQTFTEVVVTIVVTGLAIGFTWLFFDEGDFCFPIMGLYGSIVLLSALSFMCDRLGQDTPYRLKLIGELLGLRDFIETAEQPRLQALVDDNPEYFYDILPYAMVFGLSDKWASQFSAIDMKSPDWYVSPDLALMSSPVHMAHAISTSVSQSITSAVAAASVDPTSSSSSGGYSGGGSSFSGGGGGGGGGGSW